ncbi:enoyl-CoA hydratase [Sandaracinobacter sp. RS1-74]|uniref:enoyl-CoA hydratase n=1 Tax=Sandaracinobacteroides sayramensis TaxID=2913411 RepID=UPI001EDBC840|nr:enoyl-CoA hydratase [Sandaracinobacteroides sayramensis]MCG2840551.1 enoyl-CoA hydratase [Sandaracinobacteroides sayramensis]
MAPIYETDKPILYERSGATAWITLNRPDYGNAQNAQMLYALDDALVRASEDPEIRVIVLKGAGKHFSAGHDIGSPGRDADRPAPRRATLWGDHSTLDGAAKYYVREQEAYLGLCRRWRELPKPTIAAVHGACIAGGLMLAWVCDLIIASRDAVFSDPVLRMGVPGVEYFAHAFEMHPRVAREFLFLGERMSAERAWHLGMVNRVVDREALEAEVEAVAARLAELPAFGLTLAKQAFNAVEDFAGKRSAMDASFHMHHLAHAHNALVNGNAIAGMDARAMATASVRATETRERGGIYG